MGRIRKYTNEELIQQLKKLGEKLDRTPTRNDIIRAHKKGECAGWTTFYWWFGSLIEAQKLAGFIPNKIGDPLGYTSDELLLQYQELCADLDRIASADDIERANKEGKCVGRWIFRKELGSIKNIRRRCGLCFRLYINKPLAGSIDERRAVLLKQYNKLAIKLGRTPKYEDVEIANRRGECYSARTFHRTFGSFKELTKMLGLESTRPKRYKRR